jgi:hypothetical protein
MKSLPVFLLLLIPFLSPAQTIRLLDSGYRGADYDLISAATQEGKGGVSLIVYTLDTKRARSEIRAQATQSRLLRQLGAGAPQTKATDEPIGHALFNLLIPLEMEPFLGGTTDIQLEVDGGTAGIPWEMLESDASDDGSDPRPWAVRTKLLRKLRTADFRAQVADATADDSVLVIGEPACDPDIYPRLWGARDEAEAVAQRLSSAVGVHRVQALISPDDPDKLGADAEPSSTHSWARLAHRSVAGMAHCRRRSARRRRRRRITASRH